MKNKWKIKSGISLITLILIVGIVIIGIFFIKSKPVQHDIDGKPLDTEDSYEYLLNHKPSPEKISSATTIDYRSLYKGANTLNGNFYKITGEIVQIVDDNHYHINMTKTGEYYTYYTDRIQISLIGAPSEVLMEGDIVSFTGESLGNYTYTAVMGNESTVPFLRVYAENLQVVGHTD